MHSRTDLIISKANSVVNSLFICAVLGVSCGSFYALVKLFGGK